MDAHWRKKNQVKDTEFGGALCCMQGYPLSMHGVWWRSLLHAKITHYPYTEFGGA
jgi:hypothetical protein